MAEKSGTTEKSTDNSTTAIMFTLILYTLYFMFIKPVIKLDSLEDPEKFGKIMTNTYTATGILLVLIIIIQVVFNTIGYQAKCQGSFLKNFGTVFSATFIPWFIIMGSVMISLIVFPGFKGAFSNVFGYYAVANSSNDILVTLLGSSDTDAKINELSADDSAPGESEDETKTKLMLASDAVLKIVGNTSLMVNQITPSNFIDFWNMLTPIMKDEYKDPSSQTELKTKLLENVVLKDNIGEACWYIYTMVLLITVVKTNMAELTCGTSVADIRERTDKFNKKQDAIEASNKKKEAVTYTS